MVVLQSRLVEDVLKGANEVVEFGVGDGSEDEEGSSRVEGGLTTDLGETRVEGGIVWKQVRIRLA